MSAPPLVACSIGRRSMHRGVLRLDELNKSVLRHAGCCVTRWIIHLDLDAFFCAVEEQLDPSLRGKPFAVGGRPETRGVVSSCSYAARQFGVRSAMPMGAALRQCPDLIVLRGDHRRYRAVSRRVMELLRSVTPRVEQISIDEAFLDVTDLPVTATALAEQLQERIRVELGLPCSLGVAGNMLVAKIANNVGKARNAKDGSPPNAILAVQPGEEAAFLAPLPCTELWGVGPKTAERLAQMGIRTIGDIARLPDEELGRRFGKHGEDLLRRARGIDDRPVVTHHEPKSVSQETTFVRDVSDGEELRRTLKRLSSGVARQLKRHRLTGTTVRLKLRWSDFTTPTRQTTLDRPTDDEVEIFETASALFERLWSPGEKVRLLGVGVGGLGKQARQMSLWDEPDERAERLEKAVRDVRRRFGDDAIRYGDDLLSEEVDDL